MLVFDFKDSSADIDHRRLFCLVRTLRLSSCLLTSMKQFENATGESDTANNLQFGWSARESVTTLPRENSYQVFHRTHYRNLDINDVDYGLLFQNIYIRSGISWDFVDIWWILKMSLSRSFVPAFLGTFNSWTVKKAICQHRKQFLAWSVKGLRVNLCQTIQHCISCALSMISLSTLYALDVFHIGRLPTSPQSLVSTLMQ